MDNGVVAERTGSDTLFVRVVEAVYAIPASNGAIELDRALVADWLPHATQERFELVFQLAEWHDTRAFLLQYVAPHLLTDRVLHTAARNNLWQILAERRLLPRDFGAKYGLFTRRSFVLDNAYTAERSARNYALLARAGCALPDKLCAEFVRLAGHGRTAGNRLSTAEERRAHVLMIGALALFDELTGDDVLRLYRPLLDIARYNSDRRKRGAYVDPGPAIETLIRHRSAQAALIPELHTAAAALPADVLRAMALFEDFRQDETIRPLMLSLGDPETLVRLAPEVTQAEFADVWRVLIVKSPEHALQLIEARPELAAGTVSPRELASLLEHADRAVRTRTLAVVGALGSPRKVRTQ